MQLGIPAWPVVTLVILLFLPGLGCTLAVLAPGSVALPIRLALSFGLGYVVVAVVSLALTLGGLLTLPAVLAGVAIATVAGWTVAFVRWPPRTHASALGRDVVTNAGRYALLLVVLVGFCVVRTTYTQPSNVAATSLRYWADGVEIAAADGVPATTLQWGTLLEPTTSKIALNAFNGTASLLFGHAPLGPLSALQFVMSLMLVLLAAALAEALGTRFLMPLAPALLFANFTIPFANVTLTTDLNMNLAEDWGRIPALAAVILLVVAVRPRSRDEVPVEDENRSSEPSPDETPSRAGRSRTRAWAPPAALAAVALGVAAGTHGVATAVGFAFIVIYAVASWIADRRREVPKALATTVLGGAAIAAIVLITPGGDLAFGGAAASGQAYAEIAERVGLPPGSDLTTFLVKGALRKSSESYGPADALKDLAAQLTNHNRQQLPDTPLSPARVPIALGLVAFVVLLLSRHRDLRALGLTAVSLVVALAAVAVAFAVRYDVFALATFGNRRLFDYLPLPAVLLALGAAEVGLRWLASTRVAAATPVLAAVLVLGVSAVVLPRAVARQDHLERRAQDLEVIEWVGTRTPCAGRILLDWRTLGTWEAIAGRAGTLEGMGPHLRPDVLEIALREVLDAWTFFHHPMQGLAYLREHGIAYVVRANRNHMFGGATSIPGTSDALLAKAPFLHEVLRTPAATVYRVDGWVRSPSLPDPGGQPGYCRSG